MTRIATIKSQLAQITTIEDLTQAFEGIASIHISRIRDRVVASKQFFSELWPVYSNLRIDPKERLKRANRTLKGRSVVVVITNESRLGTEVTEQIIAAALTNLNPETTDVISVGSRGAQLLRQRGVMPVHSFIFPISDLNINAGDVIKELYNYDHIAVFYQTYETLRTQRVQRIDLISAVQDLGEDVADTGEAISSRDYIFEPGITEIADYMESVMMGVAFIQIIMEAKLAGYATRFNAMNRAKRRASDLKADYRHDYYRARRAESDERLKEVIKAAKIMKGHQT
ncbi:MAG TPA: F0F1 ATP synthase subunit gamma [Candidatus Saccharimonas sp.]|nr:F0F1 ATP synthase subunit gamma [Candidatus Saccharimonas sp.]